MSLNEHEKEEEDEKKKDENEGRENNDKKEKKKMDMEMEGSKKEEISFFDLPGMLVLAIFLAIEAFGLAHLILHSSLVVVMAFLAFGSSLPVVAHPGTWTSSPVRGFAGPLIAALGLVIHCFSVGHLSQSTIFIALFAMCSKLGSTITTQAIPWWVSSRGISLHPLAFFKSLQSTLLPATALAAMLLIIYGIAMGDFMNVAILRPAMTSAMPWVLSVLSGMLRSFPLLRVPAWAVMPPPAPVVAGILEVLSGVFFVLSAIYLFKDYTNAVIVISALLTVLGASFAAFTLADYLQPRKVKQD